MNLEQYMQDINKQIHKMYDGYINKVSRMTGYQNVESLLNLEAVELKNLIAATKSELKYELEENNPSKQITMPELKIRALRIRKEDVYITQTVTREKRETSSEDSQGGVGVLIGLGVGVIGGVVVGAFCEHPITGAVVGGIAGTMVGLALRDTGNSSSANTAQKTIHQKEVFSKNKLVDILKKREIEVLKAFEVYITGIVV